MVMDEKDATRELKFELLMEIRSCNQRRHIFGRISQHQQYVARPESFVLQNELRQIILDKFGDAVATFCMAIKDGIEFEIAVSHDHHK